MPDAGDPFFGVKTCFIFSVFTIWSVVSGIVNPFSRIFNAISSEKMLPDFNAFPVNLHWRQGPVPRKPRKRFAPAKPFLINPYLKTERCIRNEPPFKAGVNVNLSEILVSLKRGWKGKKGLWNTTRQLPDRTIAPQVVGQLFGMYLPIFNFKL